MFALCFCKVKQNIPPPKKIDKKKDTKSKFLIYDTPHKHNIHIFFWGGAWSNRNFITFALEKIFAKNYNYEEIFIDFGFCGILLLDSIRTKADSVCYHFGTTEKG